MLEEVTKNKRNASKTDSNEYIKLGNKLENPHDVSNMKKAAEILGYDASIIKTTDLYVRFMATEGEQIDWLELENELELFTHPLDYEILVDGDIYIDPEIGENDFPWLYTVVPVNFVFHSEIKYEIISETFLYNPDGKNVFNEEIWDEIELESFRLTKNISEEEYFEYKSRKKKKHNPRGCVTHADQAPVGSRRSVRGIKVRAVKFLKISTAFTDNNGCFRLNKSYKNANIKVIFHTSNGARVRSVSVNMILLDIMVTLRHSFGNFSGSALENLTLHFHFDNQNTSGRKKWRSAAGIDDMISMRTISAGNFGINEPLPTNMNIWITNVGESNAAPCLRLLRKHNPAAFVLIMGALPQIVGAASTLFSPLTVIRPYAALMSFNSIAFPPDVILNYRGGASTVTQRQTHFHEYAHVLQYRRVGAPFWREYVLHIIRHGAYGNGTEPFAPAVALMESWAEDFGNAVAHEYYQNNISPTYLNRNERNLGCNNTLAGDDARFIRLGYFHDLHDIINTPGETCLAEDVSRWTYSVQFQAFASNVRSYEQHRQAMLNIIAPQGFVNNVVRQHCTF